MTSWGLAETLETPGLQRRGVVNKRIALQRPSPTMPGSRISPASADASTTTPIVLTASQPGQAARSAAFRRIVLGGEKSWDARLADKVGELAGSWHADCDVLSSTTARTSHPAFREIVRLGPAAIPHLLRLLWTERTDWDIALEEIAATNPVGPADAGDMNAIAVAWMDWGIAGGHVSPSDLVRSGGRETPRGGV